MGLFSACVIVLDLPTWPARQRLQLKAQLIAEGAVISHAVTSRCTHLVVSADGAGSHSRLKLAAKHGVQVMCPEFLTHCLVTGQLSEPELANAADNNNYQNGYDDVSSAEQGNPVLSSASHTRVRDYKHGLPAEETFELNKVKIWAAYDNNCPAFPEEFEMVRSAIFHKPSEMEQRWAVMEIQVAPHLSGLVFRITVYHATWRGPDKVTNKRTEVRMAGSGREAETIFGCVFEVLTGEGCGMAMVDKLPAGLELGSRIFQQAQTEISMVNLRLSRDVCHFVTFIWSEALGHVSQILQLSVLQIKPKQVTKAEAVLLQLKKAVLGKGVQDEDALESLSREFYKIIPHHPDNICPLRGMANISAKLDLCQLIRDVVDASEAVGSKVTSIALEESDHGPLMDDAANASEEEARRALTLARFTALRCSLLHLEPSSRDFDSVCSQLLYSSHGRQEGFKILNIFRVERPAEIGQFRWEVGNTCSLFHAFTPRCLLGILSRGLLLPKTVVGEFGVERTDIGMLGCGIYFSDSISTSVKYARRAAAQDGTRVLAVCDVALGRCNAVRHRDPSLTVPPEGYQSLHGVRATAGATSEFEDDEFVIYDPRQQKLRYIVQFCLESDVVKDRGSEAQEFGDIEALTTPSDDNIICEPNIPELLPEQGEEKKPALCGLHSGAGAPVPLKAVHVRANILDFTAQVVVMQEYGNESTEPIEAKYTFPLDEMAAVCGFEAFINGKHIVGQVKEKETAHQQYREAVTQGHGAYLMDKESPDVFVVSVGNLPPVCRVLIKVTYVCELATEGSAVCFRLPGNLAPWQQRFATSDTTQETVETFEVAKHSGHLSVQASVEMPYEIINITSPTHAIRVKCTACKAVVELASSDDSLGSEFQLLVFPAQIHEPRMWVEHNPDTESQACMLTLYTELAASSLEHVDIALCLDCSTSMTTQSLVDAKRLALFALRHLPTGSRFNVLKFGTHYKELFPVFREATQANVASAVSFIKRLQANAGNTEVWRPLRSVALLAGGASGRRDSAVPVAVLLLTDGIAQAETRAKREARENVALARVLACGVGATPNRHFLNALARNSGGACEIFTDKNKSTWTDKMLSLLKKATQPACHDVTIEWQRFHGDGARNDNPVELQAPRMIRSLFCGTRLVIYGIVPHCTQATLHAFINNEEFSTMVSTSSLQITRGKMVHRLTAHAVIQDYEDGNLHSDETQHEVMIAEMKSRIIELSKEYSIITPYTSFVAVEERDSTLADKARGPELDELLSKECVDILPYMGWEEETKEWKKKNIQMMVAEEAKVEEDKTLEERSVQYIVSTRRLKPTLTPGRGVGRALSAAKEKRKITSRELSPSKPQETLLITSERAFNSVPITAVFSAPSFMSVVASEGAFPKKEPRYRIQGHVTLPSHELPKSVRSNVKVDDDASTLQTTTGTLFSGFGYHQQQQHLHQLSPFGGGAGQLQGPMMDHSLFGSRSSGSALMQPYELCSPRRGRQMHQVAIQDRQDSAPQRDSIVNVSNVLALSTERLSMGKPEPCVKVATPAPSNVLEGIRPPFVQLASIARSSAHWSTPPEKVLRKLTSDESDDLVSDMSCLMKRQRSARADLADIPALPPPPPPPARLHMYSAAPPVPPVQPPPPFAAYAGLLPPPALSAVGSVVASDSMISEISTSPGRLFAYSDAPQFEEVGGLDILQPPSSLPLPPPPSPPLVRGASPWGQSVAIAKKFAPRRETFAQYLEEEMMCDLSFIEGSSHCFGSFTEYCNTELISVSRKSPESPVMSIWQRVDLNKVLYLQNKDGFWDDSTELSSLIGWSPDHLSTILKNQGVRSLGLRVEESIVRLVWTLLVLQISRLRSHVDVSLNEFVMMLLRQDANTLAVLETSVLGSADALVRAASWVRATENVCPCVCTRLELGPSWQAATCRLLGVA